MMRVTFCIKHLLLVLAVTPTINGTVAGYCEFVWDFCESSSHFSLRPSTCCTV